MKLGYRIVSTIALAAASVAAVPAGGQTVRDEAAAPSVGLNLPGNFTTFGKTDPLLRKPTAIVNGDVITGTDVDQRLALVVMANGGKVSDEEKERLRVQVLRNLIDESLQIQEAKANEIKIGREEVNSGFARVAQNLRQSPDMLIEMLRENGASERTMKRQIEGEIAWSRLLQRKVNPFVNVSDDEIKSIADKMTREKGTTEYRVGEIYLSATPENSREIFANAERIMQQLRQGGSFQAYARQFSEASTAGVGGDLGWVRPGQLPDALAERIQTLQVGQIAGPLEIPGGYSIIYLIDQKKILVADPRDSVLSLRQIAVGFPASMPEAEAKARVEQFSSAVRSMQGCGQAEQVAKQFSGEMVDNDQVRIRDLPPQLQEIMINLQVGQATPAFGSRGEGVRVLIVCGREDPQVADGPSADQIEDQLRDERINRRAQIYLRDLRRDAVIDFR